jgi:hypothetical protein
VERNPTINLLRNPNPHTAIATNTENSPNFRRKHVTGRRKEILPEAAALGSELRGLPELAVTLCDPPTRGPAAPLSPSTSAFFLFDAVKKAVI